MFKFFDFFKKEKKKEINAKQLARAIVIESKGIEILEWQIWDMKLKQREVIEIDNNISVILNYARVYRDISYPVVHMFSLSFEIHVANIKVVEYRLQKDLMGSRLDDDYYAIDEYLRYHEIRDEWIDSINKWANEVVDEYSEKERLRKVEWALREKERREEEAQILKKL